MMLFKIKIHLPRGEMALKGKVVTVNIESSCIHIHVDDVLRDESDALCSRGR